jgi:Cu2+-exporting ATPase/Cu+-exporting ATPase
MGLISRPQGAGPPPRQEGDAWGAGGREVKDLPLLLRISGMWCPSCAWLVEEILRRTPGVREARVLFAADLARLRYDPRWVTPQEILGRIAALGYGASPPESPDQRSPHERREVVRLGVSLVLTANVMMISWALYAGFLSDLGPGGIGYLAMPMAALATPVIFYGGAPVFRRAWAALCCGGSVMETLIALGALAAFSYSLVQMTRGSLHLYFDTAAMLVTLVLLGKRMEGHARRVISRGLQGLQEAEATKVRVADGEREAWVRVEEVQPGNQCLIRAGERIPVDGRIVEGQGRVDESVVTGETRPVIRGAGQEVMGGTLLAEGEMRVAATRVGRESTVGRILRLVDEALETRSSSELLADRLTRWFIPAVAIMALAAGAWVWAQTSSADLALLRALTVLVISCPCALGVATPLAKVAAMEAGRSKGILVRNPGAFEEAHRLDVLVWDKTGTLTEGRLTLRGVIPWGAGQDEVLRMAAAVEAGSTHILAGEIMARARARSLEPVDAESSGAMAGMGVIGTAGGMQVLAGNRQLMGHGGLSIPPELEARARAAEAQGETAVFVGFGGQLRGLLVFGDAPKPGAREAIDAARARGMECWLVSGDAEETTGAVARALGIRHFRGGAPPEEKVRIVAGLRARGRAVGMVGDGVNDAAALASAHVGFALGARAAVSAQASDVVLLAEDPLQVLESLDLSAATRRVVRQNLLISLAYNGLGIPLAVAGVLNPLVAVLAMFASSLTVIGNSARLLRAGKAQAGPGREAGPGSR